MSPLISVSCDHRAFPWDSCTAPKEAVQLLPTLPIFIHLCDSGSKPWRQYMLSEYLLN